MGDVKNYAVMVYVMNLKARTLIHAQGTVSATLMAHVIHMKLLAHVHLIALVVIIYVTLALAKVLKIVHMTVLAMPITIVNLGRTQNIALGTVARKHGTVRVKGMTQMMERMAQTNNMTEVTDMVI